MDTKTSNTEQKTSFNFYCKKCNYKCCKKYNYERHISSDKHKKIQLDTFGYIKNEQNEQNEITNSNKYFIIIQKNNNKFVKCFINFINYTIISVSALM